MAQKPKNGTGKFWQPAIFLIAVITLFVIIATSGFGEDIKLFAVNLTITGLLAVYVYFVLGQRKK